MLVIENGRIGYRKPLLNCPEFSIGRGEFILVEGPNGSGKTTLARTILGALRLLSGQITRSFRRMAYVPQHNVIDPALPVSLYDLLRTGSRDEHQLFRLPNTHRKQGHREWLAAHARSMGIEGSLSLSLREASGGQRQRALIARALAMAPDFIVLDEPFSNLDLQGTDLLLKVMDDLSASGVSLMVIDHSRHYSLFDRYYRITAASLAEFHV